MKCPKCGCEFKDEDILCSSCGMKFTAAAKEQAEQEVDSALDQLNELDMHDNKSTPLKNSDTGGKIDENDEGDLSYETDDVRKNEYKLLLKDVFADGRVDTDEVQTLADKIRELGLDKNEAVNIQKDVAKEMGFDIEEAGDIVSAGIVLELNTNKAYVVNEMNNFEFRIKNVCDEPLKDLCVSRYLLNLDDKKEEKLKKISAYGKKKMFLSFLHKHCGNEVVKVRMQYTDSNRNPSVYEAEFEVKVYDKEEVKTGDKSISISFNADRILGNDFSNMAEIMEKGKAREPEKGSSYDVTEKQWKRLCIFLSEEETSRKRDEVTIIKNMEMGEKKSNEGLKYKEKGKGIFYRDKDEAKKAFKNAYDCFKEAEDCFKKVREINPKHEESLKWAEKNRKLIKEIEGKIGRQGTDIRETNLTSACLEVGNIQKKFFVYSKNRVTLGRESKNDIVLRMMPYSPKEEYLENWTMSGQISRLHAEIIYKKGYFCIRDISGENMESTNGTYLERKRLKPLEDYPLKDGVRLNVARVLDLECSFLSDFKKTVSTTTSTSFCETVLGDSSNSCFGIDKKGDINAIKLKRRNNYVDGEEYMILIREATIGRSRGNGIVIDREKVSVIHAKLFYRDGQYWIEDLNSRHGTLVNGQELEHGIEAPLGIQADITIGDVEMTFKGMG